MIYCSVIKSLVLSKRFESLEVVVLCSLWFINCVVLIATEPDDVVE